MKNLMARISTTMLFLLFSTLAFAQPITTFSLQDGSSIRGKLLNFENQVYTIATENLGTITLNQSNVVGISSGEQKVSQPLSNPQGQNMDLKASAQQMQRQLMSDPEVLKEMQELAQDESVKSIISDPEVMKAIMSYDPNTIMGNEKTRKLMENPKIQRLMELISKKYMPQQ